MTTLEIILIAVLWIITAIILSIKFKKVGVPSGTEFLVFVLCWFATPFTVVFAMIRQTFFEDWR